MNTYKITVEYTFETNADTESEALVHATNSIYYSLHHNLKDSAKVTIKKI